MKLKISANLGYTSFEPGTIILNIHALDQSTISGVEQFSITEPFSWSELPSFPEQSRLLRIEVDRATSFSCTYHAELSVAGKIIDCSEAIPVDVNTLHPEILYYLHPSRYCQSDKLIRLATHQFGRFQNELEKVTAISEWIHNNVEYLSGSTNPETSAYDTVTQQAGVCRDFAHLGIALCRALTIPARYCAAYAYQLIPQDFHACFEAYINGHWIIFDATKLAPLNGLIKIAVGRDAADTAVANLFGNIQGDFVEVDVRATESGFSPVYYLPDWRQGISL